MKMSWYYRMLLSYTPIFFVVISVLIFSFFAVLNNSAQKQIVTTNQAISAKVLQVIDANLKLSERMLIKEIYTNQALKEFFALPDDKALYDYFRISQKMDELSSTLPLSNSIYLYNANSGKVLSRSGLSSLDQFGDRNFLLTEFRSGLSPNRWTDPRPFREFSHESSEERVVSLVKYYPDGYVGEKQGAVVVNIRVSGLVGFVKDLTRFDAGPIMLFASDMAPFDMNGGQHGSIQNEKDDWLHTKSEYTGWKYVSGAQSDKRLSLVSIFNDFWMIVGIVAITSGLVWFTYITHRNYKPIQAIAGRIHNYTKRKSGELVKHAGHNELQYIEAAIDALLERAGQYEQLHKDDMLIRRRQMLFDWLEGHRVMNETQWKQEATKFQLPTEFQGLTAAALEIDRFRHFTAVYTPRDQYLLKFILSNALQEIALNDNMFVWSEWFEPQQMGAVFYLNTDKDMNQELVSGAMKKLQDWISGNLDITVSVGLGSQTRLPTEVAQSFSEAKEHLSYKPVFGLGCMIGSRDIQHKAKGRIFPHLQSARTIVRSLRLDDGQWQFHFTQLFHTLKKGCFSQADIGTITNYMMYHLHKEIMELADGLHDLLQHEYVLEFEDAASGAETLEEWRERLCSLLTALDNRIRSLRSIKNNYAVMCDVKQYIELHYADPNLSLNQVSDKFGLNPRYLSKLFKEEFGEKFIDYMMKVRLEEAEKLLLGTVLPVQDIAERVGYGHVISFHRAFKNMFGLPPGDYRKRTAQQ